MAFRPEPWAETFIKAAGTPSVAEEALEELKVFCRAALALPGDLSGKNDADRLGRSITAALARFDGIDAGSVSAVLAVRFVQQILRKGCFHQYKKIIRRIQKDINKKKGIEEMVMETAAEPAGEFLTGLTEKAKTITGAREVQLTVRLIPELIGGFRLRWGSLLFDGSVKRRLQKMAEDLGALKNGPGYGGIRIND